MNTEEFFNNEENVKEFLGAKTEKEAREFLESKCGKKSDEEFSKLKKGLIEAVEDARLEASGGLTPKKIAIRAVGAALFALGCKWVQKKNDGEEETHKTNSSSEYDEFYPFSPYPDPQCGSPNGEGETFNSNNDYWDGHSNPFD